MHPMNSEVTINTTELHVVEGKLFTLKILLEEVSFLIEDKIINLYVST